MQKLRILCGTDFAPSSRVALDHALLFAEKDGAALHVVHAYSLPVVFAEGSLLGTVEYEDQLRAHCVRSLGELVAQLPHRAIPIEPHVVSGPPAEALAREAERLGCDLVVIGSGAAPAARRFLLGSVAERVVQTSSVDVLTVPPSVTTPPLGIRTVLCAVDFSIASEAAFLSALDLSRRHGAALHVAHAWDSPSRPARDPERADAHERELSRDLEELVHRHPSTDVAITRHVRRGVPYAAMVSLARELGVDLLVAGTTGKSGLDHFLLGSVAERIIRASPVPVLAVRGTARRAQTGRDA